MSIYEYVRPLGKIEDDIELRNQWIAIYDSLDHKTLAAFCLRYANHLLTMTGFDAGTVLPASINAIQRWLEGKTNYQEARHLGGDFNSLARSEGDPVKVRFYRTLAQISAVPHVKYHALWATDYAITLVNRMHPGDKEVITKERVAQITILRSIAQDFANQIRN
jgi:hypothetical protein